MELYASIVGYGFLALLALFFLFFIVMSSAEVKEQILKRPGKPLLNNSGSLTGEMIASLNPVYYSVITLILLYVIILVLTIF